MQLLWLQSVDSIVVCGDDQGILCDVFASSGCCMISSAVTQGDSKPSTSTRKRAADEDYDVETEVAAEAEDDDDEDYEEKVCMLCVFCV